MKQVIYNGETAFYAPCSDPSVLTPGKVYTVVREIVSTWHTEYVLEGIDGEFNSVWFNPVMPTYFAISNDIPKEGYSYRCKKIIVTSTGCYLHPMKTSNVQDVELISLDTYQVTTLNSIYIVKVQQ